MRPEKVTVPVELRFENATEYARQCKRIGQAWIELGFTYERLAEISAEELEVPDEG